MTPVVSVLMPVFNAERYLTAAAESVLGQTFGDFELIAVDDGSTDGSGQILAKLAAADRRVRVVTGPNVGVVRSLNMGLALARGQYVARMDADDVSLPDRFQRQVDFLRANPECTLVGSRVMTIDPYGTPLYEPNHSQGHEDIDRQLLAGVGWAIVHPAAMMVREAIATAGGYRAETEPSEDLDLFLRMAERGRVANLPVVLLHYRQHLKSVNHTRAVDQDAAAGRIIADAYRRRRVALPPGWVPPKRDVLPVRREVDMWAWVALKRGDRSVARRHALSLMRIAPLSVGSWRLLFCALRGH